MSSIHRQHGKKNWFCAYTGADGKRHFKSTGTSDKRQAKKTCDVIQSAVDERRAGKLTAERARRVIENAVKEIVESSGERLPTYATGDFVRSWLRQKEGEIGESTFKSYDAMTRSFLEFLGARQKNPLTTVTVKDIREFRDHLAVKVSSGTVNNNLKMLRLVFEDALRETAIERNPAKLVKNLDRSDKHERRAFTEEEIKKLLGVADTDWRTMILGGLYTGLRLSDISNMTWETLDLPRQELTIATQKTGRTVDIAIAKPLLRHLETLPTGDDPKAPLCPSLSGKPAGQVSNLFFSVMTEAGLVAPRDHSGTGKGIRGRRHQNELSFHCLRHTATTWLKNSGATDAVTRDIIGHDSASVSKVYTHISSEAKRQALDAMPDVTL
jgi:integrase